MKENKKSKLNNKLIGLLILIVIISPIIGIFYFSYIGLNGISLSMFGTYFMIFGIIAIINTEKKDLKIFEIIFILIGLVIISIGIINQFGTNKIVEFINSIGVVFLFEIFCIIIGIGLIIGPKIYEQKMLKRCTMSVIAECINMDTTYRNSKIILASPIWQYTIGEKKYTYCNNIYNSFSKNRYREYREYIIGTTCKLFVNPEDFTDAFEKIPEDFKRGNTFLGIIFLLGAVFIMFSIIRI